MTTIYEAKGFWARYYGWQRFGLVHSYDWLFFARCQVVHSLGLSVTLWVLFVDCYGEPLGEWRCLKPNRLLWCQGAHGAIESAVLPHKKRHRLQMALLQKGWLKTTTKWEVGYFDQKYYEK